MDKNRAILLIALRTDPEGGLRLREVFFKVSDGKINLKDMPVYSTLLALELDGLIMTHEKDDDGCPPKKYYKLTEFGNSAAAGLDSSNYNKFL